MEIVATGARDAGHARVPACVWLSQLMLMVLGLSGCMRRMVRKSPQLMLTTMGFCRGACQCLLRKLAQLMLMMLGFSCCMPASGVETVAADARDVGHVGVPDGVWCGNFRES